ncbi:MAG: hypothetical protein ABI357_05560 [Granulicella sp.]
MYEGRPYPHILPLHAYQANILPSIRNDFWRWRATQNITLHKYFGHLNSSQAACFNLFFPFITATGGLQLLGDALKLSGIPVAGAAFEFVPDRSEGTNIDFMLPFVSGARVLFEIKYTEQDFAKAASDPRHHSKFQTVYAPRLASRLQPDFHKEESFSKHYQIARNILHLGDHPEDTVIFLIPRANKALAYLPAVLDQMPLPVIRPRVRIVYFEDLLQTLTPYVAGTALETPLTEFREKYFPT